ncbi:MAG: hypothetical protein UW51_C0003G0004 [Candidatus Amesbacteria bacterium GW2011_GWA1_44_24]|nr:MAG: hypothetical protein UW51_C0003G0004 [Candidatus Amesbacteria bacterium GW2011_GWA1_44_24]KKU30650.1 MAG: hypothetical protein UX46_C0016G0004 [Candidatus Amesbacteria bacterium GW2011_GWC1_46_24]
MIIDLIGVSSGTAYLLINSKFKVQNSNQIQNSNSNQESIKTEADKRIASIEGKLAILEERIAGQSGVTVAPPTRVPAAPKATVRPKTRSTQYITISGSGSSSKNDWESLTGTEFYFDPGDYPGLIDVYFEANMKLFNGNGMAFVRLYDATHGVGVQGSEALANSQTNTVSVSGRVSFWSGRNLIKVQAKSLTADTAVYNSGRLKIISEN